MKTAIRRLPVLFKQRKLKKNFFRPCASSPPEQDNRFTVYVQKAIEIINKNDPGQNKDISETSQRQLVDLQKELWGKPTILNGAGE